MYSRETTETTMVGSLKKVTRVCLKPRKGGSQASNYLRFGPNPKLANGFPRTVGFPHKNTWSLKLPVQKNIRKGTEFTNHFLGCNSSNLKGEILRVQPKEGTPNIARKKEEEATNELAPAIHLVQLARLRSLASSCLAPSRGHCLGGKRSRNSEAGPRSALLSLFWGRVPNPKFKIDYRKKIGYPGSKLSTLDLDLQPGGRFLVR